MTYNPVYGIQQQVTDLQLTESQLTCEPKKMLQWCRIWALMELKSLIAAACIAHV